MPHTQCYENITRRCEGCARSLIAVEMVLGSQLLQTNLYCLTCAGSLTSYYYDVKERGYVDARCLAKEPRWSVSWLCESRSGCQISSSATRIEVSVRFLRIEFSCPTCLGRATRYYDLEHHGYADVTGRIVPRFRNRFAARNYTQYVGAQWE